MQDPRQVIRQKVATLLEEPGIEPGRLAADLVSEHGDEAYRALWQVLTGLDLPLDEARSRWEEAEVARERMVTESGGNSPILPALVQIALRIEPGLATGRLLSAERYRFLEESSYTDGLTGLYNYRYFRESIRRELKRSKRYRHPFSLVLFDLDDFKIYNDANGHPAGDRALQETGRLLAARCREIDIVCRYGGEEFVVILPGTEKGGARVLGEKMRQRVEEHSFEGEEACPRNRLTISGGIAAFPEDGLTVRELLENADRALYQAKDFIKNSVCFYYREERRAYPRVERAYGIRYRAEEAGKWGRSATRDISRGGLSFYPEEEIPDLGTALRIEVTAGGGSWPVKGRVVRVERYEKKGRTAVGIAFEPSGDDLQKMLEALD